jgi:uncharacterized protein YuzE
MKIRHDREGNVVQITFNDRQRTKTQMISDEVLLHFDENDRIIGIQVLGVNENIPEVNKFEYTDITNPRYDQKQRQAEKNVH